MNFFYSIFRLSYPYQIEYREYNYFAADAVQFELSLNWSKDSNLNEH